jgi:glycosyltransferase involved in cell wall biosynthesis
MKRRVAHLHTGRSWGGGEYQVLNLVRGLVRRGEKAVLFGVAGGKLLHRAQTEGLDTRRLSRKAVAEFRPDIIHAHDSGALSAARRRARELGAPVVFSRRVASPLRRNPFSRAKYSAESIAAVLAISETVKQVFAASGYPPDRIYVVPSGLDLEALDDVVADPGLRRHYGAELLVAGVGSLTKKKNWQMLVRTAALLNGEGWDLHWLLAGEGPERESLEALAAGSGVGDRVHFLGFREDAQQLIKSCDLLFFPSLIEGASVTVREAMALGAPVVAVDAAGTAESLNGHGCLVAPDDVDGAARAVRGLLTDSAARTAMVEAARESARRRFSFDRTVRGTMEVYDAVLSV